MYVKHFEPHDSVNGMTDLKASITVFTDMTVLHKELDETSCPICMEYPHNAVLLICRSHEKGCRSYICDTSYRHSNCLDRYRKLVANNNKTSQTGLLAPENAHTGSAPTPSPVMGRNLVETNEENSMVENTDGISISLFERLEENNSNQVHETTMEGHGEERQGQEESGGIETSESNSLKCPLCRGAVLGWTIVKEARQYLDQKPRSCTRESCSFSGNYKELRRHARRIHPTTRPADVDPSRQRAWRRMEHQREYDDTLSAIRSAMPGATVIGDYVIDSGDGLLHDGERNGSGERARPWWTTFFLFHVVRSPIESLDEPRGSSRAWRRHRRLGHHNLWGENLMGVQDVDEDSTGDDAQVPRRRRRFLRTRPDEDQP